ncbi:hypothetical protein [Rhodothalassium salexigens]|uniref:hypothetical protein n=1 Tax=Rhodothalassium salexigens TaxID=1086 RepID=UPI00104D7695|nr:hypothetical protein [Rhodothalassium salexigens]MBB4211043.1 hypothetical protein [Rhodothalassium salexigens DSM 2132]MBK1637953.1 hypothetical protein [Rhodothalassium salexigens DSM 2132]
MPATTQRARANQEDLLLDYLKGLRRHTQERSAIRLALSDLERRHREAAFVRSAAQEIRPLVNRYEGQLFRLANSDIIVVVKGASRADLDIYTTRERMLFRKDNYLKAAEAVDQDLLVTQYDLERDYERFRADMEALVAQIRADAEEQARQDAEAAAAATAAAPSPWQNAEPVRAPSDADTATDTGEIPDTPGDRTDADAPAGADGSGAEARTEAAGGADDDTAAAEPTVKVVRDRARSQTPLDPLSFNRLANALRRLDGSVFATTRPIIMMARGTEPRRVLTYHTFSLERVEARLMPEFRLDADAAYARKLHQTLNRQVIGRGGVNLPTDDGTPLLLDFELDAALDPDAMASFETKLAQRSRGKVILGFRAEDVLHATDRYLEARRQVRARGLRTAVTGIDLLTFGAVSWTLLPAEFYTIPFRDTVVKALDEAAIKHLAETIRGLGPARVMLFGCNRASAIDTGRQLGFRLFEGAIASATLSGGGAG